MIVQLQLHMCVTAIFLCYDGALVMPREFAVMDEEEMTYTEGGKTIAYRIHYAATSGAMTAAALFHLKGQFKGLSLYDLAAEIWFHAYAYIVHCLWRLYVLY